MSFKESVKKSFNNEKEIVLERYAWAKSIFIILGFVFFLNFFFLGAWFYSDFFIKTLPFSYILFLFSFLNYLYFYIYKTLLGKISHSFKTLLFVLFTIFFILFSFPFLSEWGFLPILQEYVLPLVDKYILPFISK